LTRNIAVCSPMRITTAAMKPTAKQRTHIAAATMQITNCCISTPMLVGEYRPMADAA
jgi:hypothetical protein